MAGDTMSTKKPLISPERYAECERIRATYIPKPVEWGPEPEGRGECSGDFGDYRAGAAEKSEPPAAS